MTATGNILTDAPATWKALGWNLALIGVATDAVPRVDADAKTYPIANWKDSIDNAFNDINDWMLGNATATGPLLLSTNLEFAENTTVPGGVPGVGQGKVWVRDDIPNVLVYTNDAGTDVAIGAALTFAQVLVNGNSTGGTDLVVTTGDSIRATGAAEHVPIIPGAGGQIQLTGPTTVSSELLLNGAILTNAPTSAADLIIGDGTTLLDYGLSIYTNVNAEGALVFTSDGIGGIDGAVIYNHVSTRFELTIDGASELILAPGAISPAVTGGQDIGTESLRFNDGFLSALMINGAVLANGPAVANDVVIGNAAATTSGITGYTTTGGTFNLVAADSSGGAQGRLTYAHTTDAWNFYMGSGIRGFFSASVFRPSAGNTIALGDATQGWSTLHLDSAAYVAGALVANGVAVANDIVIGSGLTTVDHGVSIYSNVDAEGSYSFTSDGAGTEAAAVNYQHATGIMILKTAGSGRMNISSTYLRPAATGTYELGTAGRRWEATWTDLLYVGGGIAADGSTGATDLVVGAIEAVNHGITIVSGTANIGTLAFTDTTGGVVRGHVRYLNTGDSLALGTSGSDRVILSSTQMRSNGDGTHSLGATGQRWTTLFAANLVAGGAIVADGQAGKQDLVLGDGTADAGATIFVNASGSGWLVFTDTTGTYRSGIRYTQSDDNLLFYINGVKARVSETHFGCNTAGLLDLGTIAIPWGDVFASGTGMFGGGVNTDANALARDLVVGEIAAVDSGITILTGAANTGRLVFTSTVTGAEGFVAYNHASPQMDFAVASSTALSITATQLLPGVSGMDLGGSGSSDGWEYLFMGDTASAPTVVAGDGAWWVQSDDPTTGMFEDSDGNSRRVSRMETITLSAAQAMLPATGGPTPGVTNDVDYIEFTNAGGAVQYAWWQISMPWNYGGQDIVVRLHWHFPTDVNLTSVVWQVAWERHVAGLDLTSSSFSTPVTATVDPAATTNALVITDIVCTSAQIDGLLTGEPGRLQVHRNPAHASDDFTNDVRLMKVEIMEV